MEILKRNLYSSIANHLIDNQFLIITGARQTGKTTLLKQIAESLKKQSEDVYYMTLEDPAILSRLNQHPENLFEFALVSNDKRLFVLIDEIQYLENPTNFLKLLFDKYSPQLKLVVTGSSAFYIDTKFTDSLVGRKLLFNLRTLDFSEYLLFRTGSEFLPEELNKIRVNDGYLSANRNELFNYFGEYLVYGGYPAVVLARSNEERIQILKDIMASYVRRDVTDSNIRDQEKFYRLMMILAQQISSLLNINELSRTLQLSVPAIENYLYVIRKCFHIDLLKPFYRNIKKELTKMPKVYFNDHGLRNILINQFNPLFQRMDKGELIENYSYLRLRDLHGEENLRYWRVVDGNEIDFVVQKTFDKGEAIEIKYDESGFNPKKYSKFTEAYPTYPLSVRAYNAETNKNSLLAL